MSRRGLGWLLIVYGLLGLALVVGGAIVGMEAAARVERTAALAGSTLGAAARTTRAAADSFVSVDASLAQAQESASGAAELATEASATLRALSLAMTISLFGTQPLEPLAGQFATSADQAEELGTRLGDVATSMSDTRTDVSAIGVELEVLGDEIEALQAESGVSGDPPPLRLFMAILVTWLAIPAVGGLLFGLALIRLARSA